MPWINRYVWNTRRVTKLLAESCVGRRRLHSKLWCDFLHDLVVLNFFRRPFIVLLSFLRNATFAIVENLTGQSDHRQCQSKQSRDKYTSYIKILIRYKIWIKKKLKRQKEMATNPNSLTWFPHYHRNSDTGFSTSDSNTWLLTTQSICLSVNRVS